MQEKQLNYLISACMKLYLDYGRVKQNWKHPPLSSKNEVYELQPFFKDIFPRKIYEKILSKRNIQGQSAANIHEILIQL